MVVCGLFYSFINYQFDHLGSQGLCIQCIFLKHCFVPMHYLFTERIASAIPFTRWYHQALLFTVQTTIGPIVLMIVTNDGSSLQIECSQKKLEMGGYYLIISWILEL